ncbi:MAG TPA: DUF2723 domain-containing protein [bacterium]|nr:DUF2723 domain-containing protein [bacterium]
MSVRTRKVIPSFTGRWSFPLVTLPIFAVYLVTLNPSLFRNDSPETITACWTLGVSHPPGYPLFTLLGRVFTLVPLGNPAMNLNLFAALSGALGAYFFFELARSILEKIGSAKSVAARTAALTAAYAFAFSKSYWSASLATKGGIYSFQVALELATLSFLLCLMDKKSCKWRTTHPYESMVFVLGLGLVNQWPTQFLLLAALAIAFFAFSCTQQKQQYPITLKTLLTMGTFFLLVLSLYLYVPIRAHLVPALNFGDPSDWSRFMGSLLRTRYFKTETMASALGSFWATFSQKSLYISDRFSLEFPVIFSCFALWGIWPLQKRNFRPYLLLSLMLALITIAANLVYLQVGPIDFWHLDDHLLTLNWITGLWGAAGLHSLFSLMGNQAKRRWVVRGVALALPLLGLHQSLPYTDQTREFLYRGIGIQALRSMERRPTYFAESDFDYFSLLYLQAVEDKRPDLRIYLCTFLKNEDWEYISHSWIPKLGPHAPPIYCAFANGDLVHGLSKRMSRVYFSPTGSVMRIQAAGTPGPRTPDCRPLDDLWDHYLDPALSGRGSYESALNPINGLMTQLCAHPYLNMAHFLLLKKDWMHWDSYTGIASALIQDQHWIGDIWSEKARTDETLGRIPEAIAGYGLAMTEYKEAGDISKYQEMKNSWSRLMGRPTIKTKNPTPPKRNRVR